MPSPAVLPAVLASVQVARGDWLAAVKASDWQVDASSLQQFDSSALALLLDLSRSAATDGCELSVHQAPAQLQALARLYGVDALIF